MLGYPAETGVSSVLVQPWTSGGRLFTTWQKITGISARLHTAQFLRPVPG